MTTDMENNDSTSTTGEIFLVDNDEPVMNIAFDALEMIRKTKKIIVKGKGEMCELNSGHRKPKHICSHRVRFIVVSGNGRDVA